MKHWLPRFVIMLHIGLALGYGGLWIMTAAKGEFWRSDFTAYYTGWTILLAGHDADKLYDLPTQTAYQQTLLPEGTFAGGLLPYINPPHMTVPFVPLALLPRPVAFLVWSLGQFALLVWVLVLLNRITQEQGWSSQERLLMLSAVCAFPALLVTGMLGSFSLLMLVSTIQVYRAFKQPPREAWAGVWLVVGSVKPQLMLVPAVIALVGRRWRVLITATLLTLLMVMLSLVYPGWQSWQGFLAIVRSIGNAFDTLGNVPTVMWNIKGTLTLLLGSEQRVLINAVSLAMLAVALGVVWWLWHTPWRPTNPHFDLNMALSLLLGLLCSPHLNPHDGLLLVFPAVLFYGYLRQQDLPPRGYAVFVLSCPLLFLVSEFTVKDSLGVRLPVLAMLVLVVWMAWAVGQARRQTVRA